MSKQSHKSFEESKRESAVVGERQTAVVSIRIQTDLFQFSYTKTVEREEREFTIRFYAFASGTEMLLKLCCDSEYVNEYKHCCFANTFLSLQRRLLPLLLLPQERARDDFSFER